MRSRRALLYMPGDDWKKITKALTLGVDCICMDMEDGAAASRKAEARETIARALRELDFGTAEKLARINGIGTGLEADDLAVVLPFHPDGVVLPKAETPEQVAWVSEKIEAAELKNGWPVNSIRMILVVESARGILNLKELAAHPRLDALIFGAEDYAASIGATRTAESLEVLYARSALVTAAAAHGLQAIDLVTVDFRDPQLARRDALFGAQLGYTGKQVIHPAQVEPVQDAFTPNNEAIAYAKRVVQTFEMNQARGTGAYDLDGKMIDLPLLKSAQNVLERARAAGKA
ncbi:MAG: CoA ester lyase [Chloroflexi bacterium HGW-Chloroflexi-6]|nr:MAG: CoA ester lyase [Chloroflexi bacterium HGW-Chloroflexi-6]